MQPTVIRKNTLFIAGIAGSGSETAEVWNNYDNRYKAAPFDRANRNGYEVRFFDGTKKADPENNIHVGCSVAEGFRAEGVSVLVLPEADYAVFEVFVAQGYDSENAAMDRWLADNTDRYRQLELEGMQYIVECYNEKFKGGDQPDSVVEIWIPVRRLCI